MHGLQMVWLVIYLAAAIIIQIFAGNFPADFFAFPLNVIFLILWIALSTGKNSGYAKFMTSSKAAITALALFATACLITGLIPQLSAFTSSWVFVAICLFFITVLLHVLIRGFRKNGKIRWFFVLNHAGLLLALVSGFFGAPDKQSMKMLAYMDTPVTEAITDHGSKTYPGYSITLHDFSTEYYQNGIPSAFEATVEVNGRKSVVRVNHPVHLNISDDLYLAGYDGTEGESYCVLQIVREPWKYGIFIGILCMLAGAFMMFIKGPVHKRKS